MTKLTLEEKQELIRMALAARERAYAPYSDFMVGAALRAEDGRIFTGCNVENAAFTPTSCAERTALFKAVAEGVTRFTDIAVVGCAPGRSQQARSPRPAASAARSCANSAAMRSRFICAGRTVLSKPIRCPNCCRRAFPEAIFLKAGCKPCVCMIFWSTKRRENRCHEQKSNFLWTIYARIVFPIIRPPHF